MMNSIKYYTLLVLRARLRFSKRILGLKERRVSQIREKVTELKIGLRIGRRTIVPPI